MYDLRPKRIDSITTAPSATDLNLPSTKSPEAKRTPGCCPFNSNACPSVIGLKKTAEVLTVLRNSSLGAPSKLTLVSSIATTFRAIKEPSQLKAPPCFSAHSPAVSSFNSSFASPVAGSGLWGASNLACFRSFSATFVLPIRNVPSASSTICPCKFSPSRVVIVSAQIPTILPSQTVRKIARMSME